MAKKKGIKPVIENRKARHDYFVEESYECGIELKGTEVKSLRQGKGNLKESFAHVKNNEVFVEGMHISSYEQGSYYNTDPLRPKRLLLHKREIFKLSALAAQDGYALVPLSVYLKDAKVKVELGVCKGKKNYDKREATAKRDARREMDRAMRARG